MMEGLSLAPVWFIDVIGSSLMIVLTFICLYYAVRLRRAQPSNVIWTYLYALSLALAAFSVSRAVGHIAKRFLLLWGGDQIWGMLSPYSGAVNTLTFLVAGAITLFFQRVQRINTAILRDQKALEEASREVMRLNSDLQSLVEARTHQLGLSETKYRAIFEGSMDLIFVLDEEGQFADINHAAIAALGHNSWEDLVGTVSLESLFATRDDYHALMENLRRDGFVRDRECRLKLQSGSEALLLLSMTAGKNEAGEITSCYGIAKDITARRRMEKQLQRADKLASLGQISAGIAHEINNPLGVILGYSQLIKRSQPEHSQEHQDLQTIERQARNCKRIVEDLLKFARAAESKKASIDVNHCLREVVALLGHQFELDKILVETRYDPDLPIIEGDAEKMKQVFMNLLMNAKQAISEQGSITVSTQAIPGDGHIRIAVADDGCGIPQEIAERIFDPFFTTKPVGEGTGLGLSVSYGIIQDHSGSIEVSSREGHGSTFTIVLPTKAGDSDQVTFRPGEETTNS